MSVNFLDCSHFSETQLLITHCLSHSALAPLLPVADKAGAVQSAAAAHLCTAQGVLSDPLAHFQVLDAVPENPLLTEPLTLSA